MKNEMFITNGYTVEIMTAQDNSVMVKIDRRNDPNTSIILTGDEAKNFEHKFISLLLTTMDRIGI